MVADVSLNASTIVTTSSTIGIVFSTPIGKRPNAMQAVNERFMSNCPSHAYGHSAFPFLVFVIGWRSAFYSTTIGLKAYALNRRQK